MDGKNTNNLIPKSGGYRQLRSFIVAQLVYDITVRFVELYIDRRSRTCDQMVQAARSGVQNIAEGSVASATSKKTELKLTNVAKASLEELLLDYEDFLRQRGLPLWGKDDFRRQLVIDARCENLREFQNFINGQHGQTSISSTKSIMSIPSHTHERAANAAHVLIGVATSLLARQIDRLAKDFESEGGFTERLYRIRTQTTRK
jgi:four helix bundle suffix protein